MDGAHSTSSEPSARVRAFVRFVVRRGAILWAIALVVLVPAVLRASGLYLRLKSDIEELLPRNAPSVNALDELRTRMPGLRYLGILVDTGSADNLPAAERFLDDLAARVTSYPKGLVARVKTGIQEERSFFDKHAPLYIDVKDLETTRDRIEAARDESVSRALGLNLDDDEPPSTKLDLSDIEAKYRNKVEDRFPSGRFSSKEKKLSLMLIEVAHLTTGADLGNELYARVNRDIRDLGGLDHYAPGMRLGFTGDIAIDVEEMAALVQDLTISSIAVIALVLAALFLFYRWWGAVPALLLPLFLGATYAFALVTLPPFGINNLNSNTAFLGSVIVGNGINFGIVFLARYVEERRGGRSIEDALAYATWGTRVGTLVASLAAGAAYGSLSLTQFRGFKQFGIIGGIGMLACWCSAFVLGPSLIAWLDRHGQSLQRSRHAPGAALMEQIARFVTRRPSVVAGCAAVVTLLAATRLSGLNRSWIEYDFSKLRRADSAISGEAYWGGRMDDLLGRYLTPLVMLTDDAAEQQRLSSALKEGMKEVALAGTIDSVVSITDLVPNDQTAKIALADTIRRDLTPRIRARLSADERTQVDRWLGASPIRPVIAADLPLSLSAGLRERDGTTDKAVLLYPHPSHATWQGESIIEMTNELRRIADDTTRPGERPARLCGSIPLSSDIITSIEHDGPIATAVALFGVIALVFAALRSKRSATLVVGSLLVAVVWLIAGIMTMGVKINFANFIAFPITFGIGVDYAVNVMARHQQSGSHDVAKAIRSTGGAVMLCSATTIIGYSSLLFAQNRALFLFGVVAVLGEVACLLTAIIVLPSVLMLLTNHTSRPGSDPERRASHDDRSAATTVRS